MVFKCYIENLCALIGTNFRVSKNFVVILVIEYFVLLPVSAEHCFGFEIDMGPFFTITFDP